MVTWRIDVEMVGSIILTIFVGKEMANTPDQYRVFGNPISQSKSPFIHTLFARQTMQNLQYQSYQPEDDDFISAVGDFFKQGGRGCNITAPYKEQAFQFADRLTERAQLSGAVNTLKKLDDGEILVITQTVKG